MNKNNHPIQNGPPPDENNRTDVKWKEKDLIDLYLKSIRKAIPFAKEQIDVMRSLITATNKPLKNIMDIGCGDGILGAAVLNDHPEAKAYFTDFAPEMLQTAHDRLKKTDYEYEILLSDYSSPSWLRPFSKLKFDVIISGFSIHHQPDERKKILYNEIYGLLVSGGIFINIEHVASTSEFGRKLHLEKFIDSMFQENASTQDGKTRQDMTNEYQERADRELNVLALVEDQCEWLRDIGFVDVDCYFKYFELSVFAGIKP
ncbi:MAG: methyltransferase domain-containing protein [Deltaproteobacteria bacterium]|nr:methyltransferase domain-containing protein [Deltaproteobacteria bacterium]